MPEIPTVFPYVSTAINLAGSIYKSYETKIYRTKVLDGIQSMNAKLKGIKDSIKVLEAASEYGVLKGIMHYSPSNIDEIYYYNEDFQKWLKDGVATDDLKTQITNLNPKECLTKIDFGIRGDPGQLDTKPWLQIYLRLISSTHTTSKVESAYNYFSGYMLAVQLRALTLLRVVTSEKDMITIIELANKRFVFHGEVCQKVMNNPENITNKDNWTIANYVPNGNIFEEILSYSGNPPDFLVEGHAICGFRISINANNRYGLKLKHGKVNEHGYIDKKKETYQNGNFKEKRMLDDSGFTIGYINTDSIELPEGYVITNIGFNVYKGYEIEQPTKYGETTTHNCEGMHLVVKCAPILKGGKIDASKVKTLVPTNNFEPSTNNQLPPSNFINISKYVQFNGTCDLNTPLTGILVDITRVSENHLAPYGKESIHLNSFKAKDE